MSAIGESVVEGMAIDPVVTDVASSSRASQQQSVRTWIALWTVYIVWGSTYLAIRIVVQTMPPLLSAGVRFITAGALMYGFLWLKRGRTNVAVTKREFLSATLVGTGLLLGGNGLVSVAEQNVPSALAALLIASVPLWVILLRFGTGDRVSRGTLVSVAVGFAGVALLVRPGARPGGVELAGIGLMLLAAFFWACASFMSGRLKMPKDPLVSTGLQMLTGGAVMTIVALAAGEISDVQIDRFSTSSILALLYLIVVGSLLAFTAYVWLLQNAPISKVATYAYVNPVIAIFLGWAILAEPITGSVLLGAAVIVASVAVIVRRESQPRK